MKPTGRMFFSMQVEFKVRNWKTQRMELDLFTEKNNGRELKGQNRNHKRKRTGPVRGVLWPQLWYRPHLMVN